jgi:hypothetical protein
MGIELVNACVFCAAMLFGTDLPVAPGLGAEMGFSYSTFSRKYTAPGAREDVSDVTPKFVVIGLGNSRAPSADLGAGTPMSQWQVLFTVAPSHDESARRPNDAYGQVTSTGTGRYENFAGIGRIPLGERDSVELAFERRSDEATDTINVGGSDHNITQERTIGAERVDFGGGWRHRWPNLEVSAAFRYAKISGSVAEQGSTNNGSGGLFGGELEGRWRRGRWTFVLHGAYFGGSLNVFQQSLPNYVVTELKAGSSLSAIRGTIGYSWPRTDLFLTTTYDRQDLPTAPLAVLGTESLLYDQGYRPESSAHDLFFDLLWRYRFASRLRMRVGLRLAWGSETNTLIDTNGGPSRVLSDIERGGDFGGGLSNFLRSPQLAFLVGAELFLGSDGK